MYGSQSTRDRASKHLYSMIAQCARDAHATLLRRWPGSGEHPSINQRTLMRRTSNNHKTSIQRASLRCSLNAYAMRVRCVFHDRSTHVGQTGIDGASHARARIVLGWFCARPTRSQCTRDARPGKRASNDQPTRIQKSIQEASLRCSFDARYVHLRCSFDARPKPKPGAHLTITQRAPTGARRRLP